MRSLTFFFLLLCSVVSAQNWALLNPAYKYHYPNDGSDTISNQIFVTHIDTLGVDSFRYVLNRIGVVCSACSPGYSSGCWFGPETDLIHATSEQAWAGETVRAGTSWILIRQQDTLLLKPLEQLGANWAGPDGISGTIFSLEEVEVFGDLDSLKWIGFSNGDTLALSKGNGVFRFNRSSGDAYALVGLEGLVPSGLHFPKVIDLFDYQVGDVLQYHDESSFQSSFCVHFVEGRTKYEVIGRSDDGAVTTYTLERTFTSDEESYYPQWWTPCGSYHDEGQEQITLIVDHERFTEENLFGSGVIGPLYPSVITEYSVFDPFNGLPARIAVRLDTLGRYVLEPYIVNNDGMGGTVLCPSMEDSLMFFPDGNIRHRFSFTEHVGLTYSDFYYFEGGATRTLEGYMLGGEDWGTVWSNSVILGAQEGSVEGPRLFPNPANDFIILSSSLPGTRCSIADLQGRIVLHQRISSTAEHIDVRALQTGVYMLSLDDYRPQRFVIAR